MSSMSEKIGLSTLPPGTDNKGAVGSDISWQFLVSSSNLMEKERKKGQENEREVTNDFQQLPFFLSIA